MEMSSLRTLAVIVLGLLALVDPLRGEGAGGGIATIIVAPSNCLLDPSNVIVHEMSLATGQLIDVNRALAASSMVLRGLADGRNYVYLRSGTCAARFYIGIFTEVGRTVVVRASADDRAAGTENDAYTVPVDCAAVRLPFPAMSVSAKMADGSALSSQVVGQYAFIDDIPRGKFAITVSGANFWRTGEFYSSGANRSFIVSIP